MDLTYLKLLVQIVNTRVLNGISLSVSDVLAHSFQQSINEGVIPEKVSEYDQEMPQSHSADQPTVQLGRDTEYLQSHDTKRQLK